RFAQGWEFRTGRRFPLHPPYPPLEQGGISYNRSRHLSGWPAHKTEENAPQSRSCPFITPGKGWVQRPGSRRAADHRLLLEHLLDQHKLPAGPQDVRDLELLRVRAGRPDSHVAGPEAEQPVAEHVVGVLLHHDPERVVRLLPRPDHRADADLPSRE